MYGTFDQMIQDLAGAVTASNAAGQYPPEVVPSGVRLADELGDTVAMVAAATQDGSRPVAGAVWLPPWVFPPAEFQPFDPAGSLATPAVGSGDTIVLTLVAPPGFDGVVRRLGHNYTGGGLSQGSGGIVWRLLLNGNAVRNYDAMTVEFGSPQQPRNIDGIRLKSGDVLQYIVNVAGSGGFIPALGTYVICSFGGWFYPRMGSV